MLRDWQASSLRADGDGGVTTVLQGAEEISVG